MGVLRPSLEGSAPPALQRECSAEPGRKWAPGQVSRPKRGLRESEVRVGRNDLEIARSSVGSHKNPADSAEDVRKSSPNRNGYVLHQPW